GSVGRDRTELAGRGRGEPLVSRAAAHVSAAVRDRGRLLDHRRPHRESLEALRGHEGQRQRVSRARRSHGSHRQSDGSGPGAAARPDAARSREVIGVAVLGSTGSVGESTLDVLARHRDRFRLVAIAANSNSGRLAQQEALVMAGPLLLKEVGRSGATLLPIDSEHNAIFQCLPPPVSPGVAPPGVRRLLLTASGGPFRDTPREALDAVTPEAAIAHPNWIMGRKISVDSATLMNK